MQSLNKTLTVHVACELILIGGVSLYFHKQLSKTNLRLKQVEDKLRLLEQGGLVTINPQDNERISDLEKQLGMFAQQTQTQISALLRQKTESSNIPGNHATSTPVYSGQVLPGHIHVPTLQRSTVLSKPAPVPSPILMNPQNIGVHVKHVAFNLPTHPITPRPSTVEVEEIFEDEKIDEQALDNELLDEIQDLEKDPEIETKQCPVDPAKDISSDEVNQQEVVKDEPSQQESTKEVIESNPETDIKKTVPLVEEETLEFIAPSTPKKRVVKKK